MRHRTVLLLLATLVLGLLAFASTASTTLLTTSAFMGSSDRDGMMESQSSPHRMRGAYQQRDQGMMEECQGMMDSSQQSSASPGTAVTGVTKLTIQNFTYQPATIQVRVGSTVTWTNQDPVQHSVTFKNGMQESGLLAQGQSFSYTFTTPGTYQYFCTVHPSMVAVVRVVA